MHYRGGDIDHIAASGLDRDNWNHAKAATGRVNGSQLVERVHGVNHLKFRVNRSGRDGVAHVTREGWSKGSSNRYVYRGAHVKGYLSQTGHFTDYYHCSAHTLTFTTKAGKLLETETRISSRP